MINFTKRRTFQALWLLILTTFLVLTFLVFLAYQKAWYNHLVVDFGFYYYVAFGFFQNLSFGIIPENSYFPGSLFFFLIPAISFLFTNYSWPVFILSFIFVNIILIITHLIIYYKQSIIAPHIFLAILVFSGPLILFRHELFPSLVLLLSILFFRKNKINPAAFSLGLATSIKIYPALILPYYLMLFFKRGDKKRMVNILGFFTLGIFLTFGTYLILGSPFSEITASLNFNATKPVHIESSWASILTLKEKLTNDVWILGRADQQGIYGLDPSFVTIPITFFNYFWIIPISIFYLYIYKKSPKNQELKIEITFLIILLFIIFSKIITPQYLFWFLLLFPLIQWKTDKNYLIILSLILIILIVSLTQYIYPLHYTELLWNFYTTGADAHLFYALLFRNIFLFLLFILMFKYTFLESSKEEKSISI